MWKLVLAGSTAIALTGATLVYAQQGPGGPGGARDAQRWRPNAEDVVAFGDARIAALKAGLHLTGEQEKLWPPVEKAMRDMAKQRSERFAARASADRPADPVERMKLRADAMTQGGTSLKAVATAAAPLYQSLDDGQKHRFMALARLNARDGGQWHHRGRGHREGFMHGRGGRGDVDRDMPGRGPGPDRGPRQ